MASKNRPKELIRKIMDAALIYAEQDYPEEDGYQVSRHGDEIWVDKGDKEVLSVRIERFGP